jgi:endonuclease/exonuclease/phosphatase family metal-dependent hydrolase
MQLRIATLNVWALPEPLAPLVGERMRAIGAKLPSLRPDVVAFQEVWTSDARETLLRAGRRAGLPHAWHREAAIGGSGLLVLSRIPLRDVRFERFAWRGEVENLDEGEYYGGKGFATLRIDTSAGPLAFVCTHLHARYSKHADHEYRPQRTAQVVELAQRAHEVGEPLLFAGDFNFGEEDGEYAIFTGLTGARDVAAEVGNRQATVLRANPYRAHSRKPDRRKDFVFARDGDGARVWSLRTERIFDEPLELGGRAAAFSNHAGLLAQIDVARDGAARAPRPRADAVRLAERLLAEGRRRAVSRQSGGRAWAVLGLGCAGVAASGARSAGVSRRALLRGSLNAAALIALWPGVGFSLLSELFVSDEIRAFDDVAARLARLERALGDEIPS